MSVPVGTSSADRPTEAAGPPLIRPEHKTKYAIVYIRQSTLDQVRNHTGSTESQRALAELPRQYGWPCELILVIDEDLGLSGTSSNRRTGLQRIEAMLDRGQVGLVIVRDASRLSRDPETGERFLKKAIRAGILLEVDGRLIDLARSRPAELLGVRLNNLMAWWDNEQRRHNFQAAKLAKIAQGWAVSQPPMGYVKAGKGQWEKGPEPAVCSVIRQIIEAFLQGSSVRKTRNQLHDAGVRFPRRVRGRIEWERLQDLHVYRVLNNPNYTADYHYCRSRAVQDESTGRSRPEWRSPDEWLIIKDHHEPYMSREEWDRIQSMLHGRGPRKQPFRGKGAGLLQGLLFCGHCNRWIRTVYDGRTNRPMMNRLARYRCAPADKYGGSLHRMSCSGAAIDHIVVQTVLAALTAPNLDDALRVLTEDRTQQEAAELARRRHLQRAEEHVFELKRRYLDVDPAHCTLKVELEQDLDAALREVRQLRQAMLEGRKPTAFSEADAAALIALTANLEVMWNAATTTNEDRKLILGTVITKVVLHESNREGFDVEIVWASGFSERRRLLKPPGGAKLLERMAAEGRPASEILATITELGLTTHRGKFFTPRGLKKKLWELGSSEKKARVEALLLIRQMMIECRPRREILHTLQTKGPQPEEGEWTPHRLYTAIKSLLTGAWAPAIPPLPAGTPRLRRLEPEAIQVIADGRQMGRTFAQIADELNSLGFRTPLGKSFTKGNLRALYEYFRKDPTLERLFDFDQLQAAGRTPRLSERKALGPKVAQANEPQ